MPNVLVDVPADMLEEIDLIVAQRKKENRSAPAYKPTPAEKHEAWRIAEAKGAAHANAYLKSLSPPHVRSPSRVSVVRELLQIALCASQYKEIINPEVVAPPPPPKVHLNLQGKPLPMPRKR